MGDQKPTDENAVQRGLERVFRQELRADIDRVDRAVERIGERLDRMEGVGERIARLEVVLAKVADSSERRAIVATQEAVAEVEVRKTARITAIREAREANKVRRTIVLKLVAGVAAICGLMGAALSSHC